MRKQIFGRQFKRDIHERKALFKSLMSELVLRGRITTTHEKAQSIRPSVEKLVTKAKKNGKSTANLVGLELFPNAIEKLISDIAPRFKDRPGGYTRIIKLSRRVTDGASQSIIEWVEPSLELKTQSSKLDTKTKEEKKMSSKKLQAKPAKKEAKTAKKEPKKAAKAVKK